MCWGSAKGRQCPVSSTAYTVPLMCSIRTWSHNSQPHLQGTISNLQIPKFSVLSQMAGIPTQDIC